MAGRATRGQDEVGRGPQACAHLRPPDPQRLSDPHGPSLAPPRRDADRRDRAVDDRFPAGRLWTSGQPAATARSVAGPLSSHCEPARRWRRPVEETTNRSRSPPVDAMLTASGTGVSPRTSATDREHHRAHGLAVERADGGEGAVVEPGEAGRAGQRGTDSQGLREALRQAAASADDAGEVDPRVGPVEPGREHGDPVAVRSHPRLEHPPSLEPGRRDRGGRGTRLGGVDGLVDDPQPRGVGVLGTDAAHPQVAASVVRRVADVDRVERYLVAVGASPARDAVPVGVDAGQLGAVGRQCEPGEGVQHPRVAARHHGLSGLLARRGWSGRRPPRRHPGARPGGPGWASPPPESRPRPTSRQARRGRRC